jgi:glycosyltransferase involved in cell wall biosynthesis
MASTLNFQPSTTAVDPASVRVPLPSEKPSALCPLPSVLRALEIALLTGGIDKPYAIGLTTALASLGTGVDYIGSDDVDGPELHNTPLVNFLNLRGDQRESVSILKKLVRVTVYYCRLFKYARKARPNIFHILWNNRFEWFDRTLLILYYRLLGKKVVLTAHNVNAGKRDGTDTALNRASLKIQYRLADHIFVHTRKMRDELLVDFGVPLRKISVIPFGINNIFPSTDLTSEDAKRRLGLCPGEKAILFFGRIAPYKGVDYLIPAFVELAGRNANARLIIAGKIEKGCSGYWESIQRAINASGVAEKIIQRIEFISDNEVELYFKAGDVLVIPYTSIFQSGVPFLAYSFGLPVVATDVGSLREDIIEGKTGFICKPQDPSDLARNIEKYFSSDLYRSLDIRRQEIRAFAMQHHSWTTVGRVTRQVYENLNCSGVESRPKLNELNRLNELNEKTHLGTHR